MRGSSRLAEAQGLHRWRDVRRLVAAARANDVEEVRAILRIRPELVNTVEAWNYEYTALHYAVLGRLPEMVRTLMQLGADPHAGVNPHIDATSPLTIATERGYDEVAAILGEERRREADRPTADDVPPELRPALRAGDEDRAIDILEGHPALIHFQVPDNRRTLLHMASALLLRRTVTWLLDHGSNVNARASDGTPLEVVGLLCTAADRAQESLASYECCATEGPHSRNAPP